MISLKKPNHPINKNKIKKIISKPQTLFLQKLFISNPLVKINEKFDQTLLQTEKIKKDFDETNNFSNVSLEHSSPI